MKVIQVNKPGELAIVEKPMPEITAVDEVIVRIKAAGICGSDVHIFHGKNPFASYPRVLGHEAAGEVFQIGAGVSDKGLDAQAGQALQRGAVGQIGAGNHIAQVMQYFGNTRHARATQSDEVDVFDGVFH